jgi:MFS family permease
VYGAGGVLGTMVGGHLSDKLSARTATLISMGGSAVLIISLVYIHVYLVLLLVVLLVSGVGLFFRPAAQVIITELTPSGSLVMVTAIYRLFFNLGTSAAPLLGVALVSVSYNLLFWAEGLGALIYGLIALNFLPKKNEAKKEAPTAATAAAPSGYRALLADWRFLFYLASVFFVTIAYVQYTASLPLAVVHAHLSLWWYSAVVTLNAVLAASLEVPVTKYVQAWPLRLTALAGFGLVAVGYGVYAIAILPVFLIIGTLIWTSSEMIGAPTTFAYPGMVAPPNLRGRYFGSMQSTFGTAAALGPVIGVTLWNHLGQGVWLCAAASGVIATICARIGMRIPDAKAKTEVSPEPVVEPAS